jgi:hypothetical protein
MTLSISPLLRRQTLVIGAALLVTLGACARKDKLAPCSPGDGIIGAFGSGVMALVPIEDSAPRRAITESGPSLSLHVLSALRGPLPVTDAAVVDPCGALRRIDP